MNAYASRRDRFFDFPLRIYVEIRNLSFKDDFYTQQSSYEQRSYTVVAVIEELNTKRPTLVFFWVPTKPLQSYGYACKPAPVIQC
jgi:hypothetical protein